MSAAAFEVMDEGIVMFGSSNAGGPVAERGFGVFRLSLDGFPEESFGDAGYAEAEIRDEADDGVSDVAFDASGNLVAAGSSEAFWLDAPRYLDVGLARFGPTGALDSSFSDDGILVSDLGAYDGASSVNVDAEGRIVVTAWTGPPDKTAIVRYLPDGSLDEDFAGDGIARTRKGSLGDASRIIRRGKIMVGGVSGRKLKLARYLGETKGR